MPEPTPGTIAERLEAVRARIRRACLEAGRDPSEVVLVAVSKKHPPAAIREAMAAGQAVFGENYAQELRDKARELGVGPATGPDGLPAAPEWHFVGSLQRNKVRYVVGTAVLLHAVDSERLGAAISRRALPRRQRVLVEVNIAGEATKSGVAPSEALGLCQALNGMEGIELAGLMCMPPPVLDPRDNAPYFRALAELAAEGRERGLPLHELSMGMSGDFEVAIAEGATIVRVGTAIFGPRPA